MRRFLREYAFASHFFRQVCVQLLLFGIPPDSRGVKLVAASGPPWKTEPLKRGTASTLEGF